MALLVSWFPIWLSGAVSLITIKLNANFNLSNFLAAKMAGRMVPKNRGRIINGARMVSGGLFFVLFMAVVGASDATAYLYEALGFSEESDPYRVFGLLAYTPLAILAAKSVGAMWASTLDTLMKQIDFLGGAQ